MRKPFSYIRRCLALGFMLSGMCTLTHAQSDQQGTQMHAQSDQQGTLYIEKRDGTTIKIPITPGYPQLKSEEEGARMVIQKNKTQFVELVSADIKHIYATIETSGIATMTAEDDSLLPATVYNIDGSLAGSQNLKQLPKGVYIIKKGKKSTKFVQP